MSEFLLGGDTRCVHCQVEWAHFHAGPWCWVCGDEGVPKYALKKTIEEQADERLGLFLMSRSELP